MACLLADAAPCGPAAAAAWTAIVVAALVAFNVCLHAVLPARTVRGYVVGAATAGADAGKVLTYRLNGLPCMLLTAAAWYVLRHVGFDAAFSARHFGWTVLFCCLAGLGSTSLLLATSTGMDTGGRCLTRDQLDPLTGEPFKEAVDRCAGPGPTTPGAKFYEGMQWNPRVLGGRIDVKMFLYLVGASILLWNVLSIVALSAERYGGELSNAAVAYAAMLSFFLCEYMCGEEVHLYTYDILAERCGMKLVWGCFCFYPCFYTVSGWALTRQTRDVPAWAAAAACVAYLCGWVLARGANMQKYWAKTAPECDRVFCGLVEQRTVPGTRILCSGFWGASRHINYMGEILQAAATAIPATACGAPLGWTVLAWTYPLYYIALFVPRQIDDDRVCAAKYGAAWDEYVKLVPSRIVPGLW